MNQYLKKMQEMRTEILKKIQSEGLAILKLHEKLNELNIEHEFIDRFEGIRNIIEAKNSINGFYPFDYQIIIKENENNISLVQSTFSYGITENLIEVYNFQQEPVIMCQEMATELISKKKLNSYIIAWSEKYAQELEKIKEEVQQLIERED